MTGSLQDEINGASLFAVKAAFAEPEIITRRGKPVSMILPLKDYQELLERVENAADLAWLRRSGRKPRSDRPLEDYLAAREAEMLMLRDRFLA